MQWHREMRKIIPTIRTGNDTKADDMSDGMKINDKVLEEEVDSSVIETYDRADLTSALYVIKKGTDTPNVHIRT